MPNSLSIFDAGATPRLGQSTTTAESVSTATVACAWPTSRKWTVEVGLDGMAIATGPGSSRLRDVLPDGTDTAPFAVDPSTQMSHQLQGANRAIPQVDSQ